MESGEDDIVRELQVRNGLKMLLESKRLEIVENAVRRSSRATCGRSPTPSRTRRS